VKEPFCDHLLIKTLLTSGASVLHNSGLSILHTIQILDIDTLQILYPHFRGHSVASEGFQRAWCEGRRPNVPNEEKVLLLLLEAGATGEYVNRALIDTAKTSSTSEVGKNFIKVLLDVGAADVNYNDAESLCAISAQGNVHVLPFLLARNPKRRSLVLAFPRIFESKADGHSVRAMVDAFRSVGFKPDPSDEQHLERPILWHLLKNYPNEKELLQHLINIGCQVNSTIRMPFLQLPSLETISLLCWAITYDEGVLSDDIIKVLIEAGGKLVHSYH
jgi:hypothetical protein